MICLMLKNLEDQMLKTQHEKVLSENPTMCGRNKYDRDSNFLSFYPLSYDPKPKKERLNLTIGPHKYDVRQFALSTSQAKKLRNYITEFLKRNKEGL